MFVVLVPLLVTCYFGICGIASLYFLLFFISFVYLFKDSYLSDTTTELDN